MQQFKVNADGFKDTIIDIEPSQPDNAMNMAKVYYDKIMEQHADSIGEAANTADG